MNASLSFNESLMSQMDADLIFNQQDGSITILHGKPLQGDLRQISFCPDTGRLTLHFATRDLDFGTDFDGVFAKGLSSAKRVTVLHIDSDTKKAQSGLDVPLEIMDLPD